MAVPLTSSPMPSPGSRLERSSISAAKRRIPRVNMTSPDSAPLSKHGERGVQLEFRRLGAEGVSLDELQTAFMNVVSEVRKLNGAYAS